ncbi:PIG-L deacetylase family protein [Lederbergia panacisoli]|uniref:PIG-L deacetylase family protein n=1 Tax=Lederbergia panacisoli TaxID=1255251 RepID=UPI00214A98D0|nr:PIG-L family deacetylase [Lederbergia panacisoli]MCR2822019.1 PIG-L family deacetylase [Lederbergia panacisoli]
MLIKNKIIKFIMIKVIQFSKKYENLIKILELIRGLYLYPIKMLGRRFSPDYSKTDVLVFAAHPDDDVLGLATTLYRHRARGESVKIVFVTNGTGRDGESWYIRKAVARNKADIRFWEAVRALSLINIQEKDIYCLGFPDGGTQRYLKSISKDVMLCIQKLKPKRIYVHCIEGGHKDHDFTSYVVKNVCNKLKYFNVFEWTEYNPKQPLGTNQVRFLTSNLINSKEIKIEITDDERSLKRRMLASHDSQDVEQFYMQGEAIRKADTYSLEYEIEQFIDGNRNYRLKSDSEIKRIS